MQTIDPKAVQARAEQGDIQAQIELGKFRLGNEQFEEAAMWLRRAAEADNQEAQCLLGSLLADGLGVDQDYEAAAYWLRRAAEQGHSGAQVRLAETFESGQGVPVNRSLAAQWYLRAAEAGDAIARLRYGQLLRNGAGVEKNLEEAIKWIRLSAESGHGNAQAELASCMFELPTPSLDEIITWSKAAAEQESAHGEFLAGKAFEQKGDIQEAEVWYRKAAEHSWQDALLRLAKLYSDGALVARDQTEAEKWLSLVVVDEAKQTTAVTETPAPAPVAAPINEYTPGTILEKKYFIVSVLGKGGMCRVYKAKHLLMNRMVAVKMLLPEMAADGNTVLRFQREAQAASALSHPNVIAFYDLGMTPDGKPYIVMDYLEGQSLDQRLRFTGPLPVDTFLHIFIQACAALDAAHDAGIVHRDIKPSNIMITQNKNQTDVVKVVDFGLAKLLEPQEDDHKLTKSGQVFGTLMYMSPEQCLGHPLDQRTDVYSLGCTMYESLVGTPAHSGTSAFDLMSKHINTPPKPFAQAAPSLSCPAELERIILKCLAKAREDRYQKVADLQSELTAVKSSLTPQS